MMTADSISLLPNRRGRIQPILLAEALAWAVACGVFFLLIYSGTNWIATTRTELPAIQFGWERFIPFIPAMIVPYMSIDLLFFASFFLCCRDSSELRRHVRRILFVISFAAICFTLVPLQMSIDRPAVTGLWGPWFALLHTFDHPHNLVPSLHCALATVLLAAYSRRTRGPLQVAAHAWFLLIAASTLLTYQHHALDAVTGAALGLLSLWIFPDPFPRPPGAGRLDLAARYFIASIVLGIGAILTGPIGWILFWPAVSCAIVGEGYAGVGAVVFRKRDGTLPLPTRVLLWPYLLVMRIVHWFHLQQITPTTCIAPGLVIGTCRAATAEMPFSATLDLTAECDIRGRLGRPYLNIPILDLTPPTVDQLRSAVRFIRAHAREEAPVFVYCALGLSRSACVGAAWLLAEGVVTNVDDAIARVRARRPRIVLDQRMRESLAAFDATLTSRSAPVRPGMAAARAES